MIEIHPRLRSFMQGEDFICPFCKAKMYFRYAMLIPNKHAQSNGYICNNNSCLHSTKIDSLGLISFHYIDDLIEISFEENNIKMYLRQATPKIGLLTIDLPENFDILDFIKNKLQVIKAFS